MNFTVSIQSESFHICQLVLLHMGITIVSSLENAFEVINLLSRDRPVLRVSEVCRDLSIPKSSVSRLLRTLADFGLLERNERDASYSAGPRAVHLANLYMTRHSLLSLLETAIDALVEEFGFTGYISVLSGTEIVLLRVKEGSYPLRYVREVGARLPAIQTAMGIALLSLLEGASLRRHLPNSTKGGEISNDLVLLPARLDAARQGGLTFIPSVLHPGVTTISGALIDPIGNSPLAIGLAYPTNAADQPQQQRMGEAMKEQLKIVEETIGHANRRETNLKS